VRALSAEAALQLFRAKCPRPASVLEDLEKRVVASCGGLPLALLILAGILVGQDDAVVWMVSGAARLLIVLGLLLIQ